MKLVLLLEMRHGTRGVDTVSALVCRSFHCPQEADTAAGRGGR
jgi:hypothetical protein